jgi:hypothetical protein
MRFLTNETYWLPIYNLWIEIYLTKLYQKRNKRSIIYGEFFLYILLKIYFERVLLIIRRLDFYTVLKVLALLER